MIGKSYDGTPANGVAATGVDGLTTTTVWRSPRADSPACNDPRALEPADAGGARAGARSRGAGVPARGAADAGAVVRRPHPARVLRRGVPGAGPRDGVARPPPRRPAAARALAPLVEGHDRPVRGRRRHRDDPVVRARAPVARVHGHLRGRLRPGVRARGLLVLRRGDLHRDLRLRLGSPVAARAYARRDPGGDRGLHRLADGDQRKRLDEPPVGLPARGRAGGRRRAVRRAVRERVLLARDGAHVPGRVPGRRLRHGERLRGLRAARSPRSLRARGDGRAAGHGGRRRAGAGPGRRLGGARGRQAPADEAGGVRGPRPHESGAPLHLGGWYDEEPARSGTASRSRGCSRCSPSTTRTPPSRASTACRPRTARR